MAAYDSSILQKYANKLYASAQYLEWKYAIYGGLIALIGGTVLWVIVGSLRHATTDPSFAPVVFLVILVVVFGWAIGGERGFKLRFQAQMILAQKQIEENTRGLKCEVGGTSAPRGGQNS